MWAKTKEEMHIISLFLNTDHRHFSITYTELQKESNYEKSIHSSFGQLEKLTIW